MSLLLCHECYTWVEPRANHCPDCLARVDVLTPDPPLAQLEGKFGDVLCRVGEFRVRRKPLGSRGYLYATTTGLFFVPHEIAREPRVVTGDSAGASLFWTVASMLWSPLMFLSPLLRPSHRVTLVQVYRPRTLTAGESGRLADVMMENPAAFFIPRRAIRVVRTRRGTCRIERARGAPIRLATVAGSGEFREQLDQLIAAGPWRDVIVER